VQALCKTYPNSARFSNAAAWISASCKRNLEAALVQAEHTLKLAPDNPSYLDTLAEVHFAQGNTAQAVTIQRRVVELAPLPLFRERLARFEAAAAVLPPKEATPPR
jgi:predicted Zn-dependent protease